MAFGAPDTKEEADQQYDLANPGNSLKAREQSELDQIEAGLKDDGFNLSKSNNSLDDSSNKVNDREAAHSNNTFGYEKNGTKKSVAKFTAKSVLKLTKSRGAAFGVLSILALAGTLLTSFFGQGSMLLSIVANAIDQNDSASVVKESLLPKALHNMISGDVCTGSKIKCKMGRISHKGLKKLSSAGIVPLDDQGKEIKIEKRGYPDKNPAKYQIMKDGKPIIVNKNDLVGFLSQKGNEEIAGKVFGRWNGGVFRMRYRAWTGKHIKKFFKKFNLSRNGGVTNNLDKKSSMSERLKKIRESMPKAETGQIKGKIDGKLSSITGMMSKGGMSYTAAAFYCMGTKMPSLIAAGAAAVQLAPILAIAMDVILSPGDKAKASGFDSGFSSEDMETIGTMLTEVGQVEGSNDEAKAAVDSPIFLAAIGVNKNKVEPSDYVPGYAVLKSPAIQGIEKIEDKSEPACNWILSPAAAYSSMAVEAALGAATGGVGALVSFVGKTALREAGTAITKKILANNVMNVVSNIAENNLLSKARYKNMGDVLGIGLVSFFSAGGMAQSIPALKKSQLSEFDDIKIANEKAQKEMAIATLSPFDTSSKYTFLGSIFHNMSIMMFTNGAYNNSPSSILANILKLPSIAMSYSSTANAAISNKSSSETSCDYAERFGMDYGDDAVNFAGFRCQGITKEQASMSASEVAQIIDDEEWVDDSKNISDSDDIEILLSSGYIKKDTPLSDYLENCTDASTGSYLTDGEGCVVASDSEAKKFSSTYSNDIEKKDGQGNVVSTETESESKPIQTTSGRVLAAVPLVPIYFQMIQSINGEDEEESDESSNSTTSDTAQGEWKFPVQPGTVITSPYGYRVNPIGGHSELHDGIDYGAACGTPIYAINNGTVISARPEGGWGNRIIIRHSDSIYSAYNHMESMQSTVNTEVKAGDQIGTVGTTGYSTGCHLHFSIYKDAAGTQSVDPNTMSPVFGGG